MRLNAKEKQFVKEMGAEFVNGIKKDKYALAGSGLLIGGLVLLMFTVAQWADSNCSGYLCIPMDPPSSLQWAACFLSIAAGVLFLARDYIARVAENGNQ